MKLPPLLSIPKTALVLRLSRFSWRVSRNFIRNHGLLLAGGVGYNVLLSIIPMLGLLAVLITQLVPEKQLFAVLSTQARHIAPAHSGLILDAVQAFLDARELISIAGFLLLVFFSSFAFRMLESAIAVIFHRPQEPRQRRRFWVSVVLPYAFILVAGAALLALTLLFTLLNTLTDQINEWLEVELPLTWAMEGMVNLFSFLGMVVLFSAIYKVLPEIQVAWRRAVIGGLVAALLWEGVRALLVFYFTQISFVSVIYGSVTALIIILLSLEIAAVILLLGAQVIAELERSEDAGLPWHQEPEQK
ncbi:YihY/virulence factor BrkB family protein [Natronospirillum operosum]|uniref:YihY/virulence factor BrkB family protein n=1 Tax=Natronospirillum operosum TaxID=2759953 RepID=A0A4Z0WC34_9GAMM|nr:YihY/virulence factor BrkB family protein [Natronospirillum operosum]TGG95732.1 YihY/virulence factor BrkB family protein [Natronospirillum operosum]